MEHETTKDLKQRTREPKAQKRVTKKNRCNKAASSLSFIMCPSSLQTGVYLAQIHQRRVCGRLLHERQQRLELRELPPAHGVRQPSPGPRPGWPKKGTAERITGTVKIDTAEKQKESETGDRRRKQKTIPGTN